MARSENVNRNQNVSCQQQQSSIVHLILVHNDFVFCISLILSAERNIDSVTDDIRNLRVEKNRNPHIIHDAFQCTLSMNIAIEGKHTQKLNQ